MSQAQLFISKRCPYCRQVIMVLQQRQDLKGQIRIISIDDNPFPKEIKSVPSMIVGNELWGAEDIFQFLSQNNQQQQQPQQQQQQPQQQQQQPQQQQPGGEGDKELDGYCPNGTCGLSFSSIDGNDASFTNYSLLDESPNSVPVENDGYIKKNERTSKFDSEYEKMMEERGKMGVNGPQRH